MKLLLDTHALIWWLDASSALTRRARDAIEQETTEVYISAASAVEVTTKFRLGKLSGAAELARNFEEAILTEGFRPLPISIRHADVAGALQGSHRDPFDRLLIAQALLENFVLVSNEALFDPYGVMRLW